MNLCTEKKKIKIVIPFRYFETFVKSTFKFINCLEKLKYYGSPTPQETGIWYFMAFK